jgi:hypothetical protein
MIPKKMRSSGQKDLFRSRLEQMVNRKHPLYKLAHEIDWGEFEEAYCYKGYRGSEAIEGTTIHLINRKKKSVSRWEWKWFK